MWDYKAVVNDNFSNLSVSARTDYAGSGKVRLCCDFEDEIQSYSWRRDAKQEDTDGQGFLISCGQWYFTDMMFLPGKTYEMKVWAEFPDEGIAMAPQAITFLTPVKALCAEEEIAYRPLGETRYLSQSLGTLSAYWVPAEDGSTKKGFFKGETVIEKLQSNAEYEFLLYLGGVLKRCRLNLNETGITLAGWRMQSRIMWGPMSLCAHINCRPRREDCPGTIMCSCSIFGWVVCMALMKALARQCRSMRRPDIG